MGKRKRLRARKCSAERSVKKSYNGLDMTATDEQIAQFLGDIGWYEARAEKMPADWSSRYYIRLTKTTFTADRNEKAILLVSPPDNDPKSVAGHKVGDLIRMNAHFHSIAVRVPEIIAMDEALGLVLMEDFGRTHLGRLEGKLQLEAYGEATKILIQIRDHPRGTDIKPPLLNYRDGHVYKALGYLPEYYPPAKQKEIDEQDYMAVWDEIMDDLDQHCLYTLTHIDFFAENLMWLPNHEIGVLDYQGAVKGPFIYDLVNLLEDARRDIPQDIKEHCKTLYRDSLKDSAHKDAFDTYYDVIAAQFHARVLGQIFKLADTVGRRGLLVHQSRLEHYLRCELQKSPLLKPIVDLDFL